MVTAEYCFCRRFAGCLGFRTYTVTRCRCNWRNLYRSTTETKALRCQYCVPKGKHGDGARSLGDGQTDGIIEPEVLAQTVVECLREERLCAASSRVEEYVRRKGDNIDRWLLGMRRLRRQSIEDAK